jgi:RES domain-containing protein
VIVWRLARAIDRSTAFSGIGAFTYGARWNSPGHYAVYASVNLSTAALEILVHAGTPQAIPKDELALRVIIPKDVAVERINIADLPGDWQEPNHPTCQAIGDAWIEENRSAVLYIPSAVVPQDRNVVLNPRHPDFLRIDASDPGSPFRWDPRLISFLVEPARWATIHVGQS